MTIKEFAEITNIKEYVVRRLIKEKKVVFFMSGKRAYINYPLSIKNFGQVKISDKKIWLISVFGVYLELKIPKTTQMQ